MNKGFTLNELLIVISVISLMLGFPIFGFTSLKSSIAIKNAATQLSHDMSFVKQMSISNSAIFELSCGLNSYKIKKLNIYSNIFQDIKTQLLPKGLYFNNSIIFRFSPSGFPIPGFIGTALIKNDNGKTKKIVVSSVGRIRIE